VDQSGICFGIEHRSPGRALVRVSVPACERGDIPSSKRSGVCVLEARVTAARFFGPNLVSRLRTSNRSFSVVPPQPMCRTIQDI
jgi:hypothetical protein